MSRSNRTASQWEGAAAANEREDDALQLDPPGQPDGHGAQLTVGGWLGAEVVVALIANRRAVDANIQLPDEQLQSKTTRAAIPP